MKRLLLLLVVFNISFGTVRTPSLRAAADKALERLEKEKQNLKRQTDPVGRTKAGIKVSDLLLGFVSAAAQSGDMEMMTQRLDEYVAAIQDARQTMIGTGRDANRKPKGFKDLEIALRRQMRQLEDIGQALNFDQREPVDKAKEQAIAIRESLLAALFGEQNAPSRKG